MVFINVIGRWHTQNATMMATIIVKSFLSFLVGRRGFGGAVVHRIVAMKLRRKFFPSCPNVRAFVSGVTDCLSCSDGMELSHDDDSSAPVLMKQFIGNAGTVFLDGRLSKSVLVAIVVVLMLKDFI